MNRSLLAETRVAEQRQDDGVVVLHTAPGTHQDRLKHIADCQAQRWLQVESQRRIRAVLIEHGVGLKRLYVYPEFVIRSEVLLPRERDLDLLPCPKPVFEPVRRPAGPRVRTAQKPVFESKTRTPTR